MEKWRRNSMTMILAVYVFILATTSIHTSDARSLLQMASTSNDPFSIPPLESLPPYHINDENSPPFCVYPPATPHPPSPATILPSSPPPPPSPPKYEPSPNPPPIVVPNPSPPKYGPSPSPPSIVVPSPPTIVTSPPKYVPSPSPPSISVPSPPVNVPNPPVCQAPVAHPPPPAHKAAPGNGGWCVAKPMVPDLVMQEALDYACGSSADCEPIKPNGPCYLPNTLLAHASYAFNSYWQKSKGNGGTCDFGGTAMLVTIDPSYGSCNFINN